MRSRVLGTFAVVCAAVVGLAVAAPAAQAAPAGLRPLEAPTGERCGAYVKLQGGGAGHMLMHKHCGDGRIEIEIDMRQGPNRFECMEPWAHRLVEWYQIADNAWYTRRGC